MSTLTLRPLRETDWEWINKLPEAVRLDPRGVKSTGVYTYVCEENGKPVGLAMGRADTGERSAKDTSPRTCYADYTHSMLPNRWDIILALLEREAQNALETGHTYARARIPEKGQCTNLGSVAQVTTGLSERVGLQWRDEGYDTVARKVAGKYADEIELKSLLAALGTALDKMGCKRIRRDA